MLIGFIALLVLVALGVPVAFSVTFASLAIVLIDPLLSETTALQRMVSGVNSFTFISIPFFILAGNLMNTGGITIRIFEFASVCVRHIKGGLAHVNVFSSVIFSGMSGAAVADAGGLGATTIQAMRASGYGDKVSIGVTAASSIIGPIIPPSMSIIIYAIVASQSIEKLFAAGVVPGLMMALSLMVMIYIFSDSLKCPSERKASRNEIWRAFRRAFPSLMTPFIILGGIFSGAFSPTESAAIACIYALCLTIFYREFSFKSFIECIVASTKISGQVLLIIASATLFAWILTTKQIPQTMSEFVLGGVDSFWVVLLLLNILLLTVGLFLETVAAINLLVPIIYPIMVLGFGMDPVQLGIIIVLNLIIGTLTPPFGTVLYVLSGVSNTSVTDVAKYTAFFIPPLLVVLVLVNVFPSLTLALPQYLFG